jgi:MFS family permease
MWSWLLRGLVFAALRVVLRIVQAQMINAWETQALTISIFLVAIYTLLAFVWGLIDGRTDAAREPDPDRRADLAMTWLLAGLLAGVLSGLVAWFISLFYKTLYVEGLVSEVTTFAAFTALLTFVAAIIGVTLGRWFTDRQAARRGEPVGRHRPDQGADTDVFAAVSDEKSEPATQPHSVQSEASPEEHSAR